MVAAQFRFTNQPLHGILIEMSTTSGAALPAQEIVEAQGHLIDSHIMERIFDTVVEFNGRFEVERFDIGRTNGDASHLRLKVESPDPRSMQGLLEALVSLGCTPVDSGDADLRTIEKDKC